MSYGSEEIPKQVYGNDLDVFFNAMAIEAPAAVDYVDFTQSLWNPQVTKHTWTMPDNFQVVLPTTTKVTETVTLLGRPISVSYEVEGTKKHSKEISANIIHSIDSLVVREMTARCGHGLLHHRKDKALEMKLDALAERTGFKSARLLYLNPERKNEFVLPDSSFYLVAVHDCFKCSYLYGNELRQTYNQILYELANSTLFESIVEDITGVGITLDVSSKSWFDKILDASYSLT